MWFKIGQAVSFLLASSLEYSPTSLKQIKDDLYTAYADLVDYRGHFERQLTPTMRFSHVTPPVNGSSTWRAGANVSRIHYYDPKEAENKPIAIYLPGLDGSGFSAFAHQFDDMSACFELWRMIISAEDRSEFRQVLGSVVGFVEEIASNNTDRDIVLIGESFGGVLASAVALSMQNRANSPSRGYRNPVKGLVLVNPATAFHETNWDTIVPLLASLQYLSNNETSTSAPSAYSVAGGITLSYFMTDNQQARRIANILLNIVDISPAQGITDDMFALLSVLEERLPAETLKHRVSQWLGVGTNLVNDRLKDLNVPTLVVVGDQDRIIPSSREVERLMGVIPKSEKLVVRGRGHYVLDETVNLTEAIVYSDIDPLRWSKSMTKNYDPVTDWKAPSWEEIESVIENQVKGLRGAYSPVFFSTDKRGKRWAGLSKIPRVDGPMLFVANHQFIGLDLGMIVAELIEQRNIIARGLGHPIIFNQTKYPELLGRTPGLVDSSQRQGAQGTNNFNNFQKFGAVPVTPKNYYKLMQSGQNALLFPGGTKDLFQTDPSYPLKWPEKPDFVRTVAKFNGTIIPISAVGMLESFRVLVEAKDVSNIPFIGKRISDFGGFPAARFDAAEDEREPLAPIPFPSLPARNYFVFGKPFSTHNIDPRDKEACAALYKDVVEETRRGLDDVLRVRQHDPFYDTRRRIAYEQLTNKKAPTFGVDRLNER